MKIYKSQKEIDAEENDGSAMGTVFFLPSPPDKIMMGKYWHTGIVYKDNVYECFNLGHNSIQTSEKRLPALEKEGVIFLETKIYPERIDKEINSGTSCEQFVLRVIGMSNLKGEDKGNMWPTDVYKIIKGRKS